MTPLTKVTPHTVGQVWPLFMAFPYDSILDAIIHGYHGEIMTDDLNNPQFVMAMFADILYLSGSVDSDTLELIIDKIPLHGEIHCDESWIKRLESKGIKLQSFTRYAMSHLSINRDTILSFMKKPVPNVEVLLIDETIYNKLLDHAWSRSLVENFANWKDFDTHAFGYVVLENNDIVSGTSSFSRFNDGLEIEIVTKESSRQRGYATLSAAYFIHACLEKNLVPHWDAANLESKRLAEKLGYTLERSYQVVEVVSK